MRKIFVLIFSLIIMFAGKAHAVELKAGDPAPDFKTVDDQGKPVALQDFRGKAVVLYFYPKDGTPGCTAEAQSFRDHYSEFQNLATVVLGVSYDNQASHQLFKQQNNLPFPLLVDSDHKIAQAYGVMGDFVASRDVIMIDDKGKVTKVLRNVNPQTVVGLLLKGTY